MSIKKGAAQQDLYIAEEMGVIKGKLTGIEDSIEEIKKAIIPLKKKVYMICGGFAAISFLISIITPLLMISKLLVK